MRPSGADHPSAPPCAHDLEAVPPVRASVDVALPSLAPPVAIRGQNCRLSAYARGRIGCGSTACENRPLESQEPSLRGSLMRSAIPRSARADAQARSGRTASILMSYRLPRLRLARPGIAGHRTPLQAEAPVARRHPGFPGVSYARTAREYRPTTPEPKCWRICI